MPNRTALIIHYLACLRAGLVAVPLNYRYTPPEIDYALELSGARLLLAHVERANDIAASALAGRLPLGVLTFGGAPGAGPSFEALTRPPVDIVELPEPAADCRAVPADRRAWPTRTPAWAGSSPRLHVPTP